MCVSVRRFDCDVKLADRQDTALVWELCYVDCWLWESENELCQAYHSDVFDEFEFRFLYPSVFRTNTNASRLVRIGFLNGLRVVCMFVCSNMCVMLFFQSIPYQRTNESLASFVSLCLFLRNTFWIPLCKVNHSEFNRLSLIEYQPKSNVSIYPLKLLPDYVQHNNDHHS